MSHISFASLKVQVSSSKPASGAARVSRAPEAGRVDGRDGLTRNCPNQSHMLPVHFISILEPYTIYIYIHMYVHVLQIYLDTLDHIRFCICFLRKISQ